MSEQQKLYDRSSILVKIAAIRFDKLANSVLHPYGLTISQYKILKYLSLRQPELLRQADIEAFFQMSNPTVTGLLNSLEKKDLIRRVENPDDRRSKLVQLTDRMSDLDLDLLKIGDEIEATFSSHLTKRENEELKRLLRKLSDV